MGIEILVGVVSGLIVGAIFGVVGVYSYNRSAPKRYFNRIKSQIERAISDGAQFARRNAKIIIASRNRLRDSLSALGSALNSEIDRLESMVKYVDSPAIPNPRRGEDKTEIKNDEIYEQLHVLKGYWEANEDTVTGEIKKVLVDLNII